MNEKNSEDGREKAVSRSISLPESWFEKLDKEARERFGGNRSKYLQALIERDLGNSMPEPLSPTVLIDLTRALSGEIDAQEITRRIGFVDQPRLLRKWLRHLIDNGVDAWKG
jgi:hypothetical protein